MLKAQLGGKRMRLTDTDRALLARNAMDVGRKGWLELDTLVTSDTLIR